MTPGQLRDYHSHKGVTSNVRKLKTVQDLAFMGYCNRSTDNAGRRVLGNARVGCAIRAKTEVKLPLCEYILYYNNEDHSVFSI